MIKAIIPVLFLVLISSILGTGWFWGTAVFATFFLILTMMKQWTLVTIPEMEVGVVFRRDGNRFARFLAPGHHWMMPLTEKFHSTIPLNPGMVSETCRQVQTKTGLAVDIAWSATYTLDPFQISPALRPKLARTLPKKSAKVAGNHINNVLRHIVGQYSIADLYEAGVQNRLERHIRQQATVRLAQLGFNISRVMIGAVEMPPQVRTALESALEQRLQTEQEVMALERLHQVISRFSEADMHRLMELERIQKLGQNGVTYLYTPPTASPNSDKISKKQAAFVSLASNQLLVSSAH